MTAVPSPLTELAGYGVAGQRIFVKHEYLGPTGSMKDRMVERALTCAIENGALRTGMEIVEASSGNTGAALAFAGSQLGFCVRIFVSSHVSAEKIQMINNFGGMVHAVEIDKDGASEIEAAAEYAANNNAYLFNQFDNPYHVPAYKETIGAELLAQFDGLSVRVDHFVAGVGSGGSIRAIGEVLREKHNKNLKIWAVVPATYPSDIEGLNPGHLRKQGHFRLWLDRSPDFETAQMEVQDEDAFREIIALKDATTISVGPASGSCLFSARKIGALGNVVDGPSNVLGGPGNVLVLLTDTGAKYAKKISSWHQRLGSKADLSS